MKKAIMMFICFLCIMYMPLYVNASELEDIETLTKTNSDYKEIVSLLPEIKGFLGSTLEMDGFNVSVESLDINFEKANKVYIDMPLFSTNSTDAKQIADMVKSSEYVWVLPIYVEEDTYMVNIAKGRPLDESSTMSLTKEQIERAKENEGKWTISAVQHYEDIKIDYTGTVEKSLASISYDEDGEVLLCGGLEQIQNPAAVVLDDQDAELIIPMFELPIEGTEEQITDLKPEQAGKDDNIYKYEEIKESVERMSEEDKETSGGVGIILKQEEKIQKTEIQKTETQETGTPIHKGVLIIGSVIILAGAAVGGVFLRKARK